MSLRQLVFGCVSDRSLEAHKAPKHPAKVRFGVPLSDVLQGNQLPPPIVEMLVYIAQEGTITTDLFRRPGNPSDTRNIMKRLAEGRRINMQEYNFYTLASVIKRFVMKIPGGIFGPDVELQLLAALKHTDRAVQCKEMNKVLLSLPTANQNLLALLFGTWFRIVANCEFNAMSSEAVAKSVAGSLFHTCATDPAKIDKAVQVLQVFIDGFDMAHVFGSKNIQYFADATSTRINLKNGTRSNSDSSTKDTFQEARQLQESSGNSLELGLSSSPPSPTSASGGQARHNPHKKLTHMSSLSAPEVNQPEYSTSEEPIISQSMYASTSLSRFDYVRRKQMIRMKKRSSWFLSPNLNVSLGSGSMLGDSRDMSMGKTSCDALSSDAFMSDVNAPDGGMHEYPRLSSSSSVLDNVEHQPPPSPSAFSSTTGTTTGNRSVTPNHHYRTALQPPDFLNGNDRAASPRGSPSPIPSPSRSPFRSVSPAHYPANHSTPAHSKTDPSSTTTANISGTDNLLHVPGNQGTAFISSQQHSWYDSPASHTS